MGKREEIILDIVLRVSMTFVFKSTVAVYNLQSITMVNLIIESGKMAKTPCLELCECTDSML